MRFSMCSECSELDSDGYQFSLLLNLFRQRAFQWVQQWIHFWIQRWVQRWIQKWTQSRFPTVQAIATLLLTISFFCLGCMTLQPDAIALADPHLDPSSPDAATLFETHCAGCHAHGGNIIRRGKNLKLKTLQRRQLDSREAIAQLVIQGKGVMSAYGDRLTPAEIDAVSEFVLEQAASGWR